MKSDNSQTTIEELIEAVKLYINEHDNPIQDLTMRRVRLQKLRDFVRKYHDR